MRCYSRSLQAPAAARSHPLVTIEHAEQEGNVAQIVQLHVATVRMDSAGIGRGSTFVVTLPLLLPSPDGAGRSGRRSGRSRRTEPTDATTPETENES